MSSSGVTLYTFWLSSCAWRVRIALNLKKIPYEPKIVHLTKDGGEQYKSDFKEINPTAQVPVLEIDGLVLSESVAIMEYLEETRPEIPLLPKSPKDRAYVRMITEIINSGIQPKQNLSVITYVKDHYGGEEERTKFASHWVVKGMRAVEELLEKTAGKYCVGDQITFADVCLVPQYRSFARFGIDTAPFPIMTRIVDALQTLPEFVAAHPKSQPDAQP